MHHSGIDYMQESDQVARGAGRRGGRETALAWNNVPGTKSQHFFPLHPNALPRTIEDIMPTAAHDYRYWFTPLGCGAGGGLA